MAAKSQISEGGHSSTPPSDTEPTLFLTSFLLIFDSWVRSTSGMTKGETPHHLAHPYHHPSSPSHRLQPVTTPPKSTGMTKGGASPTPATSIASLPGTHPLLYISLFLSWAHLTPSTQQVRLSENTGSQNTQKQDKLCKENAENCSSKEIINICAVRRKLVVNRDNNIRNICQQT